MLFTKGPAVLVDLSNVCRDQSLCTDVKQADFSAFVRILKALQAAPWQLGNVLAIADRSLRHLFDTADREQYDDFEGRGYIRETPVADDLLITYAFSPDSDVFGAVVVSRDGFGDFRPEYPEIQGCTDRFISWTVSDAGDVEVTWRDMGVFTHQRISRKMEEGEFKARHILGSSVRDLAMRAVYRCANRGCVLAAMWPDRLREIPDYDRREGLFRCPGCGGLLEEVGQRSVSRQVIVFHNDRERRRILLEDSESIIFGRADRTGVALGPGPGVTAEATEPISREHLRLTLTDGQITAEDLGSKNGTVLEDRTNGRSRHLSQGKPEYLTKRRRLRLPGGITLELSGRQNPLAGDRLDDVLSRTDPNFIRQTLARY